MCDADNSNVTNITIIGSSVYNNSGIRDARTSRSEERRVGKECRSRCAVGFENKKIMSLIDAELVINAYIKRVFVI